MIDEDGLPWRGETPRFDDRNLRVTTALGRGAKGVVFLARNEEDGEWLALKVISRALIERKGKSETGDGLEYKRVCFERDVLRRFRHPFLPRLAGVFETDKVVGYAIDYCPGRDLNCLRKKQTEKMFSDEFIRFYAVELVITMEYIHSLGIVYRDLKPENIMIQENGHIMLVDFDLSTKLPAKTPKLSPARKELSISHAGKTKRFLSFSRFCNSGISPEDSAPPPRQILPHSDDSSRNESNSSEKSNSFVGTEEYVAPEIVSGAGHDFAVDWWSMGVVLYEMLYGKTPFRGSNRKETFYRILTKTPELTGKTTSLRDLIRKLLEKDPKDRINLEEIKAHSYFTGVEWESVHQISRPPFIPDDELSAMDVNNRVDVEIYVQEIFCNSKAEGGVDCNKYEKETNAVMLNAQSTNHNRHLHHLPSETAMNEDSNIRMAAQNYIFAPLSLVRKPFQKKETILPAEGVNSLCKLLHRVLQSHEEEAYQEMGRDTISTEFSRERMTAKGSNRESLANEISLTASAVGASLGAGIGLVFAIVLGAASALRKP